MDLLDLPQLAFAMSILLCPSGGALAEHNVRPDFGEYQVKAAFLCNFSKFVEWPDSVEPGPIVIAILGPDPFGRILDELVRSKTAQGRRIEVRRFTRAEDARGCQIVFIGTTDERKVRSILKDLEGSSALTVSEMPQFLEWGGMLSLALRGDRVVFEANPQAAEHEGLRLSSKLLQLAANLHGGQQ